MKPEPPGSGSFDFLHGGRRSSESRRTLPTQLISLNAQKCPSDPGREHRRYAFTEGGFSDWEESQLERPSFPYDLKGAIQHEEPRSVGRAVAVRDERWTYVWRLYEPPELYDGVVTKSVKHLVRQQRTHEIIKKEC